MMAQLIDRKHLKQEMKELLRSAQVSPRGMTCLYLALVLVLNLADSFMGLMNPGLLGTFISILTGLMSMVLASGFVMYCMAIRRGERAEYLTLFDGFSFVGKVILLNIVIYLFTFFWSLLFVIPGIIAAYRYRFALYNLYENPGIGVMEALNMSKQQTLGYKGQLFMLDLSYIGWLLLASLTSVVQTGYIYACIFQDPGYYLANPAQVYAITLPMPVGLQVVLGCVWPLLVALFYHRSTSARSLAILTPPSTLPAWERARPPRIPAALTAAGEASERPIKPTSPRRVLEPAGGLSFRRPRLRAGPGALRHPASFRGPPPRQGPPSTSIFQILPQTQSSPGGPKARRGSFLPCCGDHSRGNSRRT